MPRKKRMRERILYEDEYIVAVNKHAGELVVTDRWKQEAESNILLNTVGKFLRKHGHQPDASGRDLYPVHRLDRDTSGVVLFAKHADAHREFGALFERREVEKIYWTFVTGDPAWDWCEMRLPLQRAAGKKGRGRALVHIKNGADAVTEFQVIERFADIAWLEARPRTGRLHQIRVHCQVLGHPLLADEQYGITGWRSEAYPELAVPRMPLHARFLRFQHPFTRAAVEISCPIDDELRAMLNALKAGGKLRRRKRD